MYLIVGLGNPGNEYAGTRHNAGYMAIERLRQTRDLGRARSRYHGRWCEGRIGGRAVALLTPRTFMNNSGEAVAAAAQHKHISPENIVIIHDEMDFPFGIVRAKGGGGLGGHKGLESIAARLGTRDFNRVRIGIGRPDNPFIESSDWVLGQLGKTEGELLPVLDAAADCAETIVIDGIEAAMNVFNQRNTENEEFPST